jgi:RNA polymerase sigma-70 factor (ECF subfamily)
MPGRGSDAASFEDATLVGRVAERDGAALDALYARYGGACYALARRIVADDGLAESVVLDVFRAVWEDAGRIERAQSGLGAWLLAATQRRAVDLVRREDNRRRRPTPDQTLDLLTSSQQSDGDDAAWWALRRDRVHSVLDQLPKADREILVLAYFGGYTQREIAGITGVPFTSVKSRMLAAVKELRAGLGDEAVVAP